MSAGRQIRQASKQTIRHKQCGSNPLKGLPQANSHNTWALARQGSYLWPIANLEQRYATCVIGGTCSETLQTVFLFFKFLNAQERAKIGDSRDAWSGV